MLNEKGLVQMIKEKLGEKKKNKQLFQYLVRAGEPFEKQSKSGFEKKNIFW